MRKKGRSECEVRKGGRRDGRPKKEADSLSVESLLFTHVGVTNTTGTHTH